MRDEHAVTMPFKVSVVIPNYNYGKFIAVAIDSVLNQKMVTVDVVVVDDGSTDDSMEILRSYKDNIRIYQQQHGGAAQARNLGISEARGEFIAFLDADDWLLPDSLYRRCRFLQENPAFDWVYGPWQVANTKGEIIGESKDFFIHPDGILQGDIFPSLIKDYAGVNTLTPLFRLADVRAVGGYREKYKAYEDYDFLLRMSSGKQVGFCSEGFLGVQRIHHSHLSSDYELCYKAQIVLLEDYRASRECGSYLKKTFHYRIANIYNYLACIYCEKKKFSLALKASILSILHKPAQRFAFRVMFFVLTGRSEKAAEFLNNGYIDSRSQARRESDLS